MCNSFDSITYFRHSWAQTLNEFHFSFRMDAIENENSSCLRRGAMVAHSIYGVATTINASGYGYFLALEKLFDLQHADVRFSPLIRNCTSTLSLTRCYSYDRQVKFTPNKLWKFIVARAWTFIGAPISYVRQSRSTNKWRFAELAVCSH